MNRLSEVCKYLENAFKNGKIIADAVCKWNYII